MSNAIETKTFFGCVAAVISYISGHVNELLVVLIMLMLLDYVFGTIAGLLTVGFDKKKGITGLIKKLGYMGLVLLGFLVDFTLSFLGQGSGIAINGLFGYAVTCYLIGTEGLSCLRSLNTLGLPVPQFLTKAFEKIKDNAEIKDNTEPKDGEQQ